jgi:GntR family transcriptional regulator, transcriptional repressor for pyruvate dehydrogenase complex
MGFLLLINPLHENCHLFNKLTTQDTSLYIAPRRKLSMPKGLKRILQTSLSEQVAGQISDMILSGQWEPGDKLPPEAELCKTLGVSRVTVREALGSLAFIGLVHKRSGQGTFVAGTAPKFVGHLLANGLVKSEKDINDLVEARMAIEAELAAICAERATDEQLGELERLVKDMKQAVDEEGEDFRTLDLEFHLSIGTYSQSEVLAALLKTIRNLLQEVIRKTGRIPGDRRLAYKGHLRILEALEQRNPRKARSAMRDHIRSLRKRYLLAVRVSKAAETAVLA